MEGNKYSKKVVIPNNILREMIDQSVIFFLEGYSEAYILLRLGLDSKV
jgi:hypothetical protein